MSSGCGRGLMFRLTSVCRSRHDVKGLDVRNPYRKPLGQTPRCGEDCFSASWTLNVQLAEDPDSVRELCLQSSAGKPKRFQLARVSLSPSNRKKQDKVGSKTSFLNWKCNAWNSLCKEAKTTILDSTCPCSWAPAMSFHLKANMWYPFPKIFHPSKNRSVAENSNENEA